jgi:hypothetical protein
VAVFCASRLPIVHTSSTDRSTSFTVRRSV